MALNVELFRKVQEALTWEAEAFTMDVYVLCDAPACIAGHAVFQGGEAWPYYGSIRDRAAQLLGLASAEKPISSKNVFYLEEWPYRFRRRYEQAVRPTTRARVACAYIDYLIEQEARHDPKLR
jgi:hypothetical protein